MADATLNSVNLGEAVSWEDEWNWTPVPQKVKRALDGTLIIEILAVNATGRPITLNCGWQDKDVVDALVTLRDRENQDAMTLTLCDESEFSVVFRHHDFPPVEVSPLVPGWNAYQTGDMFEVRIKLMEV